MTVAFAAPPPPPRQHVVAAEVNAFAPVPGHPAVQFIAAPSEDAALAFWHALVRRFPDFLGQREPRVIRVELGGKVFWRLRTEGFDSASDALALCARMRAGGQDCFVPRS
jgi:hypothetical protein